MDSKSKAFIGLLTTGVLIIIAVVIAILSIVKVPQGNVGVVYTPNGVKEDTLSPGWHLVAPLNKVNKYPTKTQTVSYKEMNVSTSDGKNLNLDIDVNYRVDEIKAVQLFNRFGSADIEQLEKGYLRSRVQDNVRQSVSKYSVIDAFGVKTGEIKKSTLENLEENLKEQGFIIEDIALSSPKADKNTQEAIDSRVKANQNLEKTRIDKEIAKEEAERKKIEAQGIKEANEIVSESITDEIIKQQLIEKWSGDKPITINGGTIVDLKE